MISIETSTPHGLLAAIKKAIDDRVVQTWSYDGSGDFTHVTSDGQWRDKAWLRPKIETGALTFGLLGRKDERTTKVVYGVYHGRFIEMLLTHFDDRFAGVAATAQLGAIDVAT